MKTKKEIKLKDIKGNFDLKIDIKKSVPIEHCVSCHDEERNEMDCCCLVDFAKYEKEELINAACKTVLEKDTLYERKTS